jgi:hypothetical protein
MFIRLKGRNRSKAQSTLEYAILVSVVIAALLAMRTYVKRGFQGHLRKQTDDLGQQYTTQTKTNQSSATYELTADKVDPIVECPDCGLVSRVESGQAYWRQSAREGSETGVPLSNTDDWTEGQAVKLRKSGVRGY